MNLGQIFIGLIAGFIGYKLLFEEKDHKGLAYKAGKKESDFSKAALDKGTAIEMEHTENPEVAERIAMDHLTEDPQYYEKLATIEHNPKHKKYKSVVQSLLFPKKHYTKTQAIAWIKQANKKRKHHKYKFSGADSAKNFYRFRQFKPAPRRMHRIITFPHSHGVKAVVELFKR